MRRIATYLFACAFVVVVVGCKSNGGKGLFGGSAKAGTSDPYQAPSDTASYEPTTYPVYNSQPAAQPVAADNTYAAPSYAAQTYSDTEPAVDRSTTMDSSAPRYHTVTKRDTLYAIARTYYGDQRRWKDIYEANRNEISDPNRIRVGQRLLIP